MTYVFRCASCRHEFEIIATVAEYESRGLPACPKCGTAAKRVFTPVMVMTGVKAGGSDLGDLPSSGGGCCGGACGCGHTH